MAAETTDKKKQKLCGFCREPIHYTVTASSGLWYHDSTGSWVCSSGSGDCNTRQVDADDK